MQQTGDHAVIGCVETDSMSAAKKKAFVVWKSSCNGH